MPLDLTYILHKWIKALRTPDNMPDAPDTYALLGFPGLEAEKPKEYIRRLWLVTENDRVEYPSFTDIDVGELAVHVNRVVRTYLKDLDKLNEALKSDSFLENDAAYILDDKGFGRRIWGKNSKANRALQSNLDGTRPLWGVETDSGYEENDEENIRLNLRYWMAARIQNKVNAIPKDKQPEPLETNEHIGANSEADGARSSKRHRSVDTETSFDFGNCIIPDTEEDSGLRNRRPKRLRRDCSTSASHTRSPSQSPEATFNTDASLRSDLSTNITLPDVLNVDNTGISNGRLSPVDQTKRKLQFDLVRLLNDKPDYDGILHDIIQPMKCLYATSPHRDPGSTFENVFRNAFQALEQWEMLITKFTASPLDDPLQALVSQGTFKDRVAMFYNRGSKSQIDIPFDTWNHLLTLLFDGLLGDTYMPSSFRDMLIRLRATNQPLYDFAAVADDEIGGERDVG